MNKTLKYSVPFLVGAAIVASISGDSKTSIILLAAACFLLWMGNLKAIALALCLCMGAQSVNAVPKDAPPPKEELVGQICCGLVVLVVGGVVYVGLKKLCNKCLPPPAPPTNPPPTNAPPSHASIASNTPRFDFDDAALTVYDISSYSATNSGLQGPDGIAYQQQFEYRFRYSTNAVNWITNTIVGYVSPTAIHVSCDGKSSIYPRNQFPTFSVGQSESPMAFFQPVP